MWSNQYQYFNIQKDSLLSEECDTSALRKFLVQIPELEQVGEYEFKNVAAFPFTRLLLLKAKNSDSWNAHENDPKCSNLLAITYSKDDQDHSQIFISVFIQIAAFLNWELVQEETDEGIENLQIWSPNSKGA